ncbi:hypothetical protein BGZ93_005340 [Podila epicladia]|nr:hypothetical protein BGZ92_001659 [Podila epicladia]KAG0100772.1 hypothetical protein BGZ93_005340 [Podila epicladia]
MTTDLNTTISHHAAFRYRRWLENEKQKIPDGQSESIAHIESSLPPLRGHEASVTNYIERLGQVEDQLLGIYNDNNNRYKKHTWDMEGAMHIEYPAIANKLRGIVGSSVGEQRKEDHRVLIRWTWVRLGAVAEDRLSTLRSYRTLFRWRVPSDISLLV